MPKMRRSKRRAIIATVVVVVVGAIGATSVFLFGSAQRREDRIAYLAYENAALGPIREGGRVVIQEMRPSLSELAQGRISEATAIDRANAWRRSFDLIRGQLTALKPPVFLGDITRKWIAACVAYKVIADGFERAARARGTERSRLLDQAADAGTRADKAFDEAAAVMQFHRRRLGLGVSHSLPDPASRET
jgi:hypothetical protein